MRAAWGVVLLWAPGRVLRIGGRPPAPPGAVATARVLGARQLVQSVMTAAAPVGPVTDLGTAVDALHSGTGIGLAAVSARWRRVALLDAAIGAGLAVADRTADRRRRRAQRGR